MPMKQSAKTIDSDESAQDSVQDHNNNDPLTKYAINGVMPINIDSLKTGELIESDNTDNQHYLWKPGQSGNPNGRPKGVRNVISEQFLCDLSDVWNKETANGSTNGLDVIQKVADTEPGKLLAAMVQVLPKDFQVNVTENQTHWVINCQPSMTTEQWIEHHSLQPTDLQGDTDD